MVDLLEVKFYDVLQTVNLELSGGTTVVTNAMTQGLDNSNVLGRRWRYKRSIGKLDITSLQPPVGGAAAQWWKPGMWTIGLFFDTSPQTTTPAPSALFKDATVAGSSNAFSFPNVTMANRFREIQTWRGMTPGTVVTAANVTTELTVHDNIAQSPHVEWDIDLMPFDFVGANGPTGANTEGALSIVIWDSNMHATKQFFTLTMQHRLEFYDHTV